MSARRFQRVLSLPVRVTDSDLVLAALFNIGVGCAVAWQHNVERVW